MAQKPKEPAAERPSGETFTLTLSKPIKGDDGRVWETLTAVEPELRHVVAAGMPLTVTTIVNGKPAVQAARTRTAQEQTIALVSAITGIPETAVSRMKVRDAKAINGWVDDLRRQAFEAAAPVDDDDGATFALLAPIADGGRVISELHVREPDLAAGVATEPFKTEGEQMRAMIASLTGLTIPVINGLKLRDVTRVEAYVVPLLDGSTPNAGNGSNSALPIAGA